MDLLALLQARYKVQLQAGRGHWRPYEILADRELGLAGFLADQGLTRGAEIGVQQGDFSRVLAASIPALELTLVDPWLAYGEYGESVEQKQHDKWYAEARATLTAERFQGRSFRFLRTTSMDASWQVPDNSLDFVYIDGNHAFSYVVADLAAWTSKVRSGGLICGHDYYDPKDRHRSYTHVKQAVNGWVSAYRIDPWFIWRGDWSASFMWAKP